MLLASENFVSAAEVVAKSRRVPNLPMVAFPPDGEVASVEKIRQATLKALPEILEHLTHPASAVSKE